MRDRIVWAFTALAGIAWVMLFVAGIRHRWLEVAALADVALWGLGVWLIYRRDERRG